MSDDPTHGGLIDVPKLETWLSENVPKLGSGPLQAEILSGGISNAVFRIGRGEGELVLRRPPLVPRPDSERVIAREARVLEALNSADVPTPHFHAFCDDPDVIGAKFYIMELIDGWLGWGLPENPPPYDDRESKAYHDLPLALVSGIAKLALVDYQAVGLEGFGKPGNFLERQVDRWLGQLESYKRADNYAGRVIPGIDYVADWLRNNTPDRSHVGIIHGDYSLANALFHYGTPPRLAAMIDWELSTIGDTMLDVGWVLYGYRGRDETTPPSGYFDPTAFPYREELADHYAELTGRPVENLTYYMVLAQFKLASIMEGHVARALVGKQKAEKAKSSGDFVLRLAVKAEAMARGG